MKTFVEYAIVRFMPISETQEFANVGIVLWSNTEHKVLTKLAPAPFHRINNFFDDVDGNLYKVARSLMEAELTRITNYVHGKGQKYTDSIMKEFTRQREGVMTFSEPGALLTNDPQIALEQLYNTYIGRDLKVTKEQRERSMVRELRACFNTLPLKYREKPLNTGFGEIKVPLVAAIGNDLRAIKPMAFNHSKPMDIADHGDKWISRIGHALKAGAISPENFLFTVEGPRSKKDDVLMAYDTVVQGMKDIGVNVIPFASTDDILDFAEPDFSNGSKDFALS
ncbi:DUF3037 domain-containing protein [Vibrio diabolicus]|uniref:DUF3037 domain-containing protein n=1 Tax=Vibrio diabolicus TaxID=50719 RepID=UPI0015F6B502|nr:DUF3037 domain-containing protein [Vibrio diabolicus]